MDGYTPAQAAAITGLPLSAVHKAIDNRLICPLPTRAGGTVRRLLTKEQLIYLQLEAEGLRLLPVRARREIAESIQRSPRTDKLSVANGTALLIELGAARRAVERQLKQLARMEEMVVSDPEIMRGTPVFKGTRIPVDLVADMLAQGATGRGDSRRVPNPEQGKTCYRTSVHAGIPSTRTPQPPPLAGEEGARSKILSSEHPSQECMRFLIDECLHESLLGVAHSAGFEAIHVNHLGLSGHADWDLAERIIKDEFTFVTNNRGDFVRLSAEWNWTLASS